MKVYRIKKNEKELNEAIQQRQSGAFFPLKNLRYRGCEFHFFYFLHSHGTF